ncbi:MAG: right-handed parallel beta-helix repeat-containing protein [Candidatus Cloacimonetes bacterium]|nr:right-handed parallel beta-helix repeat-containing protein [Candidatus Cloacimonadota bacterium]
MKKREIIYFIILTLLLVGSQSVFADTRFAAIDGFCYLDGEENHEGIKILFTAASASANTDSTYTNADGSFLMGLNEGIYNVQYSLEGWQTSAIPGEIEFFVDTTLEVVTLLALGIEITGSQNGVWLAGYTYNVMGDISISNGDSLTIEPGVTVKFMDHGSFTIYGKLVAIGTETDSIRFTSGQPTLNPNDWNSIIFENDSDDNSVISYSIIEYANRGIYCNCSYPAINNCLILDSSDTGIYCDYSSPTISNNALSNNNRGIFCFHSYPTITNNSISNNTIGIHCDHSSPNISNNTINNNNNDGIACYSSSSPIIDNNTISYNSDDGIQCDYSTPTISNNTISNNSDGIYCLWSNPVININKISYNYRGFKGHSSSPSISNNTINNSFIGISCDGSSSTIRNNTISDNTRGISCNYDSHLRIRNNIFNVNEISLFLENVTSALEYNIFWLNNYNGYGSGNEMPLAFGEIVAVNTNGDSCDTYCNLFMDPMFEDPGNLDFTITEDSPCIDAGDPDSLYTDPDGTIADIGAFYFDQGSLAPVINDFTGEPVEGSAPLVVQFTQDITGPVTEYHWFFGDGGTSSLPNPVKIYPFPGTYSVSLAATGPGGTDLMTKTDYITVLELQIPPDAEFSATPLLGVMPLVVDFINMSSGEVDSLFWEFGDGGFSTEINPAYEYQNSGIYTISLTIYGPYGTDTETKEDYIEVIEPEEVIASFDVSGNYGCSPYPVTFINHSVGTIDSLLWDFGDGDISVEENPFHTYDGAGIYEAVLTVYGQFNTAIDTETITVELVEPVILAITDIPEDQGGWVNVNFTRSFYDTDTLRTAEGYTIEIETDNEWTGVNSIYGYGAEEYNVIAHTLYDSTAANNGLINFRIIAAMEEGNWVSAIEQGYSVDNLAPIVPTELRFENGYLLWSEPIDSDFEYFSVFRDDDLLNNCIEPEICIVGIMGELCVCAYDCHGNASQMSEIITGGYPYGDPDNNLVVDALDASLVLQYFCLMEPEGTTLPWEEWRIEVADVDGNGMVEAYDASLILQFCVGYIDEFPVDSLMRRMK